MKRKKLECNVFQHNIKNPDLLHKAPASCPSSQLPELFLSNYKCLTNVLKRSLQSCTPCWKDMQRLLGRGY
ncbi:hypothetical protein AOLI_G00188860 [Acnodon oligacanthus]